MNNMPCEVIRDLFPSYIDEITSDASNRIIEEHLAGCEACREVLGSMKKETFSDTVEEKKEIDFLKKNRRRNKLIIFSCIAALLIILGVLFVTRYMIGEHISDMNGDFFNWDIKVDGNRVELDVWVTQDIYKITGFKYGVQDGVLNIEADVIPSGRVASLIYGKEFHSKYTSKEPFHQIIANGRILWNDGDKISAVASRLYLFRHEYYGDETRTAQTSRALNIYNYLGPYIYTYETKEPPLGWGLQIIHDIPASKQEMCEDHMTSFSYAMMAVIQNLSRVIWQYSVDGQPVTKIITAEEASDFLGQDIKNCYEDVNLLDELIHKTGLNRLAYGSEYSDSSYIPDGSLYEFSLPVAIVSHCDEEIAGITVTLLINGETADLLTAEPLDKSHTMIERGDLTHIWISEEHFENAFDSVMEFRFSIQTLDGKTFDVPDGLQIPWNSTAKLYDFHVYGNQNEGFYVEQ